MARVDDLFTLTIDGPNVPKMRIEYDASVGMLYCRFLEGNTGAVADTREFVWAREDGTPNRICVDVDSKGDVVGIEVG